ncbi:hypothetical protein DFH08DRAFT_979453 [Mycena albidolilacea]|uniref:Uncharacterized protein n=1 Tax=Mycena albidolilacea TaxID=1033008 RepID=A0AAD6YWK6_9AGAR|nr:hypothetical protein DFH08DRAFT_979453 [Mycena albidolilacea]
MFHHRPIDDAHAWSQLRDDFRAIGHPKLDVSPRASHRAPAHGTPAPMPLRALAALELGTTCPGLLTPSPCARPLDHAASALAAAAPSPRASDPGGYGVTGLPRLDASALTPSPGQHCAMASLGAGRGTTLTSCCTHTRSQHPHLCPLAPDSPAVRFTPAFAYEAVRYAVEKALAPPSASRPALPRRQ